MKLQDLEISDIIKIHEYTSVDFVLEDGQLAFNKKEKSENE